MKHVFLVHSHITYLAALGVIMEENLNKQDVVIFSYLYSFKEGPIDIIEIPVAKPFFKGGIFTKDLFNASGKIDKLIDKFVEKDNFIAYISAFLYIPKFIVTHSKCKNYNFIEEGLSAYYDHYELNDILYVYSGFFRYPTGWKGIIERLKSIKRSLGHTLKTDAIPLFYNSFSSNPNICCYGFNENAHQYAINKKVISFKKVSDTYDFSNKYLLSNEYLWIGDPRDPRDTKQKSQPRTRFLLDDYKKSLQQSLVVFLKQRKVQKVYLKFHPREDALSRSVQIKMLEDENILPIVIEDNVILEIELLKSINTTVLGVYSSLLLYAGIMGHSVYSVINYIPKAKQLERVSTFWKYVNKLKVDS